MVISLGVPIFRVYTVKCKKNCDNTDLYYRKRFSQETAHMLDHTVF